MRIIEEAQDCSIKDISVSKNGQYNRVIEFVFNNRRINMIFSGREYQELMDKMILVEIQKGE